VYYLGFCCCYLLSYHHHSFLRQTQYNPQSPLTKVIAQGSQAVIKLSYEHFPEATENTLDLIAQVGTQVGNGLDVTVKYIDDASLLILDLSNPKTFLKKSAFPLLALCVLSSK
jgi:hypothetical protein